MRFGIFYEHQLPRPWEERSEQTLLANALEQIELADRLGFDYVWEVEHHFLEEYSHSSAPEVFLAAVSQRTERIRLAHGIVQLPMLFNHPARVAERAAMLDLISDGRVDLGTGEASSQMELGGFGIDRDTKRAQWEEAIDAISRMFVEEPFAGADGDWVRMPPRNVVPKPKQRPHPPLWVACTRRDTILMAARRGIGALAFSFIEPEAAKEWVDDYYRLLESDECAPAGFAVNPNVAVVLPAMCHPDEATAIERGIDGAHFFGYSLGHYYFFGEHVPGQTDLWAEFQQNRDKRGYAREIVTPDMAPLGVKLLSHGMGSLRGAVGTPEQVTDLLERYERAGVDQVVFVLQAGANRHEHVCESIELLAERVLPPFVERRTEREARKRERLAAACERALERRPPARRAPDGYVVRWDVGEPSPAPPLAHPAANGRPSFGGLAQAAAATVAHALVHGRSDAQLDRIGGTRMTLRLVFKGMERAYAPERSAGFQGEIQYELTSSRGTSTWTIAVNDGTAMAEERSAVEPAITIRAPVPVFLRMAARDLNTGTAMLEGDFEIEGDFAVFSRMSEMFGGPATL